MSGIVAAQVVALIVFAVCVIRILRDMRNTFESKRRW